MIASDSLWAQARPVDMTNPLPGMILVQPPIQQEVRPATISPPQESSPPSLDDLPRCSEFAAKINPPGLKPTIKVPDVMMPTVYDDGFACPGGCTEPHVVFDPKHNKTSRAHAPGSVAPDFKPCSVGQSCEICFKDNDPQECLTVKYEGSGPPFGRFDFPVVFFQKNCNGPSKDSLPGPLKRQCASFESQKAKYAERVNCIAEPKSPACREIMKTATDEKTADAKLFEECRKTGEKVFNAKQTSFETKRTHGCAYSLKKHPFKSSVKRDHACKDVKGNPCERVDCKKTWSLLMPGACPKGSFVGKYNLNCCSGDLLWQVALGNDCEKYFPRQIQIAGPKPAARK